MGASQSSVRSVRVAWLRMPRKKPMNGLGQFRRRRHLIHRAGCDGAARHAVKAGLVRVLGERPARPSP